MSVDSISSASRGGGNADSFNTEMERPGTAWDFEDALMFQRQISMGGADNIFSLEPANQDQSLYSSATVFERMPWEGMVGRRMPSPPSRTSSCNSNEGVHGRQPQLDRQGSSSISSTSLMDGKGRVLSGLVPFAAGGSNPGEKMESLAVKYAELRVMGEGEDATFQNWEGLVNILLEFHGLSIIGVTSEQFDQILQVSCDVGMLTKEEGEHCKSVLYKWQTKKLKLTMDGDDWFASGIACTSAQGSSSPMSTRRTSLDRKLSGCSIHSAGSRMSSFGPPSYVSSLENISIPLKCDSPSSRLSRTMDTDFYGTKLTISASQAIANRKSLLAVHKRSKKIFLGGIGSKFGNPSRPAELDGGRKSMSLDGPAFTSMLNSSSHDEGRPRQNCEKELQDTVDELSGISEESPLSSRASSFLSRTQDSGQGQFGQGPLVVQAKQGRTADNLKHSSGRSVLMAALSRKTKSSKYCGGSNPALVAATDTAGELDLLTSASSIKSLKVTSVDTDSESGPYYPWLGKLFSGLSLFSPFSGRRLTFDGSLEFEEDHISRSPRERTTMSDGSVRAAKSSSVDEEAKLMAHARKKSDNWPF